MPSVTAGVVLLFVGAFVLAWVCDTLINLWGG